MVPLKVCLAEKAPHNRELGSQAVDLVNLFANLTACSLAIGRIKMPQYYLLPQSQLLYRDNKRQVLLVVDKILALTLNRKSP